MKFPLSWLKDHLETEADAQTIADKLTSIGLEVEAVEDAGARLKDFTGARVVSAEKHPNADRLRLCMVDAGGAAPVQVVCGAPNARAGIKVVFASPGTVIPVSGVKLSAVLIGDSNLPFTGSIFGVFSLPRPAAARSRATPTMDVQSPRLGVMAISITGSVRPSAAAAG